MDIETISEEIGSTLSAGFGKEFTNDHKKIGTVVAGVFVPILLTMQAQIAALQAFASSQQGGGKGLAPVATTGGIGGGSTGNPGTTPRAGNPTITPGGSGRAR